MNLVILKGNLTRDPELGEAGKSTVCNFGMAINERYTDRDGEKKETVTFVDVAAFGKTAEVIDEYFRKGDPILINGKLKLDEWEDKKSGDKRSKLKVIAFEFDFCGDTKGGKKKSRDDYDREDRRDRKDSRSRDRDRSDRGRKADNDDPY